MAISGTGRRIKILLRVQAPGQINERGTEILPGPVAEQTVQAVITRRNVKRKDEQSGGTRQVAVFDFYLPDGTIENPYELNKHSLEVVHAGLVCSVNTVVDWPGSHQMLTADIPESR